MQDSLLPGALPDFILQPMKMLKLLSFAAVTLFSAGPLLAQEGWVDLFKGNNFDHWRSANSEEFPSKGWSMKDGVLTVHATGGQESGGGGDILTRKRYSNFELTAEFKITSGANSGIKIFVQPDISPVDK